MTSAGVLLRSALGDPSSMAFLAPRQWPELLGQARRMELLGRLCVLARGAAVIDRIPDGPRQHLLGGLLRAERHRRDVLWELERLKDAFQQFESPVVLLKGAAYIVAGAASAAGRLFGDIDLLVRRQDLAAAERALLVAGWRTTKEDPYDVHYYRTWMHQLPPMRHHIRNSVVDLHHALRPPVARGVAPIEPLFVTASRTASGFWVPSPADMIVHSAAHLFAEGDFTAGLRDLSDMDLMIRENMAGAGWWDELLDRGRRLGLEASLSIALDQIRRCFGTPIPDGILDQAALQAGGTPRVVLRRLFSLALEPEAPRDPILRTLAVAVLYVRGYLLGMRWPVLLHHLAHKSVQWIPRRRRHRAAQIGPGAVAEPPSAGGR